jgi:hypothetical protein
MSLTPPPPPPTLTLLLPLLLSTPYLFWLYCYFRNPTHRPQFLSHQRTLIRSLLTSLNVDYSHETSDELLMETHGSFLGLNAYIVATIISIIAWIIEGNSHAVFRYLIPGLAPFIPIYFIYIKKFSSKVKVEHVRLISMIALTVNVLCSGIVITQLVEQGHRLPPEVLRRNLFSGSFIILLLYESLEDSFISLSAGASSGSVACLIQGYDYQPLVMEYFMLMAIVTLITVTSLRGRLNAIISKILLKRKTNNNSSYQDGPLKFYITITSSFFLLGAMYATTIRPIHFKFDMVRDISLAMHIPISIFTWRISSMIENDFITFSQPLLHQHQQQQLHVLSIDTLPSILQCMTSFAMLFVIVSFNNNTMPSDKSSVVAESTLVGMTMLDNTSGGAFIMLLVIVMWFLGICQSSSFVLAVGSQYQEQSSSSYLLKTNWRYNETIARIIGMLSTLLQLVILFIPFQTTTTTSIKDGIIVILGVMRIFVLGLGRALPLKDLCVSILILSLVSVMSSTSSFTMLSSCGLSALHILMALEAALTRKSILVMIQTNAEAQGFIEHALKQKFISCLEAVDNVLRHSVDRLSIEQQILLKHVIRTCTFGLDQTLYYSLLRRFGRLVTEIGGYREFALLDKVVDDWKQSWADEVEWIKIIGDDSDQYMIGKRWDLVRLMLHRLLGQNLSHLQVKYSFFVDYSQQHQNISGKMNFIIIRKGKRRGSKLPFKPSTHVHHHGYHASNGIWGIDVNVAKEMQATCELRNNGYELCLSFHVGGDFLRMVNNNNNRLMMTTVEASTATTGGVDEIQPGLVFAVLDDVKLVRINVLRYLLDEIQASTESFALGATKEEVLGDFIEKCLSTHVDVALLDVHLEFDDEFIFGTQVAVILRQRGFEGTIILHSANQLYGKEEELNMIIDGFLEKRAFQKEYFRKCVVEGMKKRGEVVRGKGGNSSSNSVNTSNM